MTKLNLSVDHVLATTRTVRRRLDFGRPVDDGVIRECLELALQSPTGSNAQSWQWMVVTDPQVKAKVADIYQRAFALYETMDGNAGNIYIGPDEARLAQHHRVMDSARYLADRMGEVPVMVIPCLAGRLDGLPNVLAASMYGSVLPGVWSFMLAARERSIGTAWTTLHLMFEEEAASVLGIPFAEVTQLALITAGYTIGTEFKSARRGPLAESLHWNKW